MLIRVKNLRLRTFVGIDEWEKKSKQDVVVNAQWECDGGAAAGSDSIEDAVDYKEVTKSIIKMVEESRFNLLEKLVENVLDLIMEDSRVESATVEIDKPGALRFCDSVSVLSSRRRALCGQTE